MHLTLFRLRNATTYTYTDLPEGHALMLVDMVRQTRGRVLVADAAPELGPYILPVIRTSWYTRDLPEED